MQEIDNEVIQSQAQYCDEHERHILACDCFALALEGPDTIPEVVVRSCKDETERIADVFIPPQFLFAEPSDAEIHDHAARADDAEADKTHKYGPPCTIH